MHDVHKQATENAEGVKADNIILIIIIIYHIIIISIIILNHNLDLFLLAWAGRQNLAIISLRME